MGFGTARGFRRKPLTVATQVTVKTMVGQGISLTQANPTVATTVS